MAFSTRATVDNHEAPSAWVHVPITAIYIDHPAGKILFDTGCREDAMTGGWSKASEVNTPYLHADDETLITQLALCGAKPEEIDYVIMSHLHLDHAGNIGLFKNAKIIVQRRELQQALLVTHAIAAKAVYIKADCDVDADWMLIDGDYTLAGGIKLLFLPGHSEGQMGLQLTLENTGTVIFASDACYTKQNYGPPARPNGSVYDSKNFFSSLEKLRNIVNETNATLIFGHDSNQFSCLKKAPDYYD